MPAHPSSVPAARRLIRGWLADAGHEELSDGAELAVSELVTNALVHAGTPVELSARLDVGFLRVEVADGSAHLPKRREYVVTAGTGRGLRMLEQTVDRWGAHLDGDGKVVWFELSADGDDQGSAMVTPDTVPDLDLVKVELVDAPLLMHAAWNRHAGALLREFLLVRLDEGDPGAALEQHAAANDALMLLADQIPAPDLGDDPEALMAEASGPSITAEALTITVPPDSVRNFTVLDSTLDESNALAEQGMFLTPPTQPEIREMRRWLCHEVTRQAAGEPATPWISSGGALSSPTVVVPLEWDAAEVDDSSLALVAADDTNRIVAASASALDLLGFDHRGALVGQRLMGLIPGRFHQAHLAGFTLHLTNGRNVLIDVPVVVPVLLRDGSERLVELTVSSHHLPRGRRVFIAEMVPATV